MAKPLKQKKIEQPLVERFPHYEENCDTNCMIVGRNLRRIRIARGLTQKEIAWALKITPQQLYKYETGKSNIDINKLNKLHKLLQVPIHMLLFDADNERQEEITLSFITEFSRLKNPAFKEAIINLMKQMNKKNGTGKFILPDDSDL